MPDLQMSSSFITLLLDCYSLAVSFACISLLFIIGIYEPEIVHLVEQYYAEDGSGWWQDHVECFSMPKQLL